MDGLISIPELVMSDLATEVLRDFSGLDRILEMGFDRILKTGGLVGWKSVRILGADGFNFVALVENYAELIARRNSR